MMHDPNKPLPNSEYNFDWLLKPIIAFFKTYFSFPKIWIEEYVEETGQHSFYVVKQDAFLFSNYYVKKDKINMGADEKEFIFYSDYNSRKYGSCYATFEEALIMAGEFVTWRDEYIQKKKNREAAEKAEKLRLKQIKTGTIKRTQIK